METATPTTPTGFFARARAFFMGAGLPVFFVSVVALYEVFLLLIIFGPEDGGLWGAFARDFKVWCFSYDPRTGGMEWASVWMMLFEPAFVAALAVLLWKKALGSLHTVRAWLAHWRPAVAGLGIAGICIGGLLAYGLADAGAAEQMLPFPGERIRTAIAPPAFELTDHRGESFRLDDARGRVVIVTGVYAQCGTSCPEILLSLRSLLDGLPPDVREKVSVVALSLNPEYDTSPLMIAVAEGYGFHHPEFRYLNGDPSLMRDLLTRWQFSAVRNPTTGTIDHANLFHVVDAAGAIAYRLTLDPRQREWLRDAVIQLAEEASPGTPTATVAVR